MKPKELGCVCVRIHEIVLFLLSLRRMQLGLPISVLIRYAN